jgi:type I restriction enzyme M protein
MANIHDIANFLWTIADDVLRDDFKRSKYPDVILPFVVLRRIDLALAPTKQKVLAKVETLKKAKIETMEGQLCRASGYKFYNTSKYDIDKLLDDPKNIARNLRDYINGFSENVRDILDKFNIRNSIDLLDGKNLLFMLVQKFTDPKADLHPDLLSNHDVGYVFEELIRRFNEQSNENPGEHFTPREVIRLMVKIALNGDRELLKHAGAVRTICDPACGTGGMLSIAKEYILSDINREADVRLFGQEVNPETYAICKSDMLVKGDDRDAENIAYGSTLSNDGHRGKTFNYQLSNPPYGKDWKKDAEAVLVEQASPGGGRFSAGLPRISDGQMLFLQHMVSKMTPPEKEGGRVAIVMNGSPLFTGDAGSGESEIRRWILENDWLETIVALPGQLFYNTGITTYIWILSNRKEKKWRRKVLLVNGAATEKVNGEEKEVFARKMRKSLGDKRNELGDEHIAALSKLAADFKETPHAKIFDTTDFGYRKVTVERPLRLNFLASPERLERLKEQSPFINLAVSKKKDPKEKKAEEAEGRKQQDTILAMLRTLPQTMYKNRADFVKELERATEVAGLKLTAAMRKAVLNALSERDESAEICRDENGNPEPDPELRDYESVPLKEGIRVYFDREVKPHVPDAWINQDVRDEKDGDIGRVGYEINFNRYFYKYEPPREVGQIEADIKVIEKEIADMLREIGQ